MKALVNHLRARFHAWRLTRMLARWNARRRELEYRFEHGDDTAFLAALDRATPYAVSIVAVGLLLAPLLSLLLRDLFGGAR